VSVPGGAVSTAPLPVVGVGYGVLQLEGEAHGTVGSATVVTLSISGVAFGEVDEFPRSVYVADARGPTVPAGDAGNGSCAGTRSPR
jgi:hypothetical protein